MDLTRLLNKIRGNKGSIDDVVVAEENTAIVKQKSKFSEFCDKNLSNFSQNDERVYEVHKTPSLSRRLSRSPGFIISSFYTLAGVSVGALIATNPENGYSQASKNMGYIFTSLTALIGAASSIKCYVDHVNNLELHNEPVVERHRGFAKATYDTIAGGALLGVGLGLAYLGTKLMKDTNENLHEFFEKGGMMDGLTYALYHAPAGGVLAVGLTLSYQGAKVINGSYRFEEGKQFQIVDRRAA